MTDITLEQSSERLRLALPLMAQNKIPITPENYWVWYQYICREIAPLTETIDKMIADGKTVDEAATQTLYKRYIEKAESIHLDNAADSVRRILQSMSDSLTNANSEVSLFEASLDECADELHGELTPGQVRELLGALSKSTQRMHEGSTALHANLDDSRDEVAALKDELERAKAEAKVDPLTKLANRAGLEDGLAMIRGLGSATSSSHALLIADIDKFKTVNDTYGHIFGDKILKVVAASIRSLVDDPRFAARFGGEEFIVILPAADMQRGAALAETIRTTIESGRIFNPKTKQEIERVTISIGVTEFSIAEDLADIIERADGALYLAKQNGRNRVEIAEVRTPAVAASA